MNCFELNYISKGKIDSLAIGDYSGALLAHYNWYFSELKDGEQQLDRMKAILLYNYNFEDERERFVFSELLIDSLNRIDSLVMNFTKITHESVNKFATTLESAGGNNEMFLHFLEHRLNQNKDIRQETIKLLSEYSKYLSQNPNLGLRLTINETIVSQNLIKAETFLIRMIKEVKSESGGCYIATMAYGDYNHPQVLVLRKFRDEKLSKSAFGRWFIKTYYHFSPKLVDRLKNYNWVNQIIRSMLNALIKLIK